MRQSALLIFRQSSIARRLLVVAIGWVASVPVLMSFAWYLWAASQASLDPQADAMPLAAAILFALHIVSTTTQSIAFARMSTATRATWLLCLCLTALFGAAAIFGTGIFVPPLELLGLFGLPHVVFVVLLFALNKPVSNPSIEGTASSKLRLPPAAPHVKR